MSVADVQSETELQREAVIVDRWLPTIRDTSCEPVVDEPQVTTVGTKPQFEPPDRIDDDSDCQPELTP